MANCELGECKGDPEYTTPIVVPGLPDNGDGGGHEFVTELPEKGSEGMEYILMDDISDCSTYRGTYTYNKDCGGWIQTSGSGGNIGKVVETLPKVGEPGFIYLVLKETTSEGDIYDEYIWAQQSDESFAWEHLGATNEVIVPTKTSDLINDSGYINKSVNDLTNYTTTTAMNTELGKKVDIASIELEGQTTTILAQVQALAAANKDYGRFSTNTSSGASGISDKPANVGFCCVAYRTRDYSDYQYYVVCYTYNDPDPYTAVVSQNTSSITWKKRTVVVDSALSTTSTNPVQNSVITAALNDTATKNYVDTKVGNIETILQTLNSGTGV